MVLLFMAMWNTFSVRLFRSAESAIEAISLALDSVNPFLVSSTLAWMVSKTVNYFSHESLHMYLWWKKKKKKHSQLGIVLFFFIITAITREKICYLVFFTNCNILHALNVTSTAKIVSVGTYCLSTSEIQTTVSMYRWLYLNTSGTYWCYLEIFFCLPFLTECVF